MSIADLLGGNADEPKIDRQHLAQYEVHDVVSAAKIEAIWSKAVKCEDAGATHHHSASYYFELSGGQRVQVPLRLVQQAQAGITYLVVRPDGEAAICGADEFERIARRICTD